MRKPIKPFAIETRRAGRKPMSQPAAPWGATPAPDEAPKPLQPEWPPMPAEEEDTYGAAMRAADALFSRPAPEPAPESEVEFSSAPLAASEPAPPPRRILESLNEDDHISRLLAEQEQEQEQVRPRRGRKPRQPGETAPPAARVAVDAGVETEAPEPVVTAEAPASIDVIPGYVRGQIYARYARHDRARPGEQWRKHSVKPLW